MVRSAGKVISFGINELGFSKRKKKRTSPTTLFGCYFPICCLTYLYLSNFQFVFRGVCFLSCPPDLPLSLPSFLSSYSLTGWTSIPGESLYLLPGPSWDHPQTWLNLASAPKLPGFHILSLLASTCTRRTIVFPRTFLRRALLSPYYYALWLIRSQLRWWYFNFRGFWRHYRAAGCSHCTVYWSGFTRLFAGSIRRIPNFPERVWQNWLISCLVVSCLHPRDCLVYVVWFVLRSFHASNAASCETFADPHLPTLPHLGFWNFLLPSWAQAASNTCFCTAWPELPILLMLFLRIYLFGIFSSCHWSVFVFAIKFISGGDLVSQIQMYKITGARTMTVFYGYASSSTFWCLSGASPGVREGSMTALPAKPAWSRRSQITEETFLYTTNFSVVALDPRLWSSPCLACQPVSDSLL